jgi:hypothetical protein
MPLTTPMVSKWTAPLPIEVGHSVEDMGDHGLERNSNLVGADATVDTKVETGVPVVLPVELDLVGAYRRIRPTGQPQLAISGITSRPMICS